LSGLADILREIQAIHGRLLEHLNGRVMVKWLDPLLTFGRAGRFFDQLRAALDTEWYESQTTTSPFYRRDPEGAQPADAGHHVAKHPVFSKGAMLTEIAWLRQALDDAASALETAGETKLTIGCKIAAFNAREALSR
jgi:hypothetical protein